MSKELIERLKDYSSSIMGMDQLAKEAADRIEALEDERDKLREHVKILRGVILKQMASENRWPNYIIEALAATEELK